MFRKKARSCSSRAAPFFFQGVRSAGLVGGHHLTAWRKQFKNMVHRALDYLKNQRISGGFPVLTQPIAKLIQQNPRTASGIGGGHRSACRVGWVKG
jgi:hypothetical protein